jgi:hypothetical protein
MRNIPIEEHKFPLPGPDKTDQGSEERRLACAIGTDNGNQLTVLNLHANTLEDIQFRGIAGYDIFGR